MKKIFVLLCTSLALLTACDKMDSNYKAYVDEHQTYAPKVSGVIARSSELGSVTLRWQLPESSLPKTMELVYEESSSKSDCITLDKLVTGYTFTGLLEQGYTFKIYTIDVFGNRSVPATYTFNPIPHREGNDSGDEYADDADWFNLSLEWDWENGKAKE